MNLKVLSPVDKIAETANLIEAGADELYCGILPEEWNYVAISPNRRQEKEASFRTFQELKECVEIAHCYRVPVFLALNEHYYTQKQHPIVFNFVEKALTIGIDAFLIADLALLLTLKEMNITAELHVSTGGTTFNSACANFYQSLGASRISLPRHLTIEEIRQIVEGAPGVKVEVFILNSKCPNVDGFCTFHHGLMEVAPREFAKMYRNACMLHYDIYVSSPLYSEEEMEKIAGERISGKRQHIWELVHIDSRPCGACALPEFEEMGIESVKIVGRGNSTAKKITDVRFIKASLDLLEREKPSREEYREVVKNLYRNTYGLPCRIYACYYPSIGFPNETKLTAV